MSVDAVLIAAPSPVETGVSIVESSVTDTALLVADAAIGLGAGVSISLVELLHVVPEQDAPSFVEEEVSLVMGQYVVYTVETPLTFVLVNVDSKAGDDVVEQMLSTHDVTRTCVVLAAMDELSEIFDKVVAACNTLLEVSIDAMASVVVLLESVVLCVGRIGGEDSVKHSSPEQEVTAGRVVSGNEVSDGIELAAETFIIELLVAELVAVVAVMELSKTELSLTPVGVIGQ